MAAHHAGAKGQKVPFTAGRFQHVQRIDVQTGKNYRSSFTNAMFRSRWVFSNDFGGYATLMLLAWCVPAVMIWRYSASTAWATSGVLPLVIF